MRPQGMMTRVTFTVVDLSRELSQPMYNFSVLLDVASWNDVKGHVHCSWSQSRFVSTHVSFHAQ